MTTAQGVHAHPHKKLGRRPEDTVKPKIRFGDILTATPPHPLVEPGPALNFPMDRNDQAGDCVVAGVDHALQVQYFLLGAKRQNWTDEQILAFYQTQNPGFLDWSHAGSDADGGMVIAQFLSYLVKQGVILGYAKVDHTKPEEVRAATYLGLCLVIGSNLQEAQQQGNVWNYVPGSPDWGGHCTAEDGFDDQGLQTISWGTDGYRITDSFLSNRVGEVYFLITRPLADHPEFRDHVSLDTFAGYFQALTGKSWTYTPTPPTPPLPPTPPPAPAPGPTPPNVGGDNWFRLDDQTLAHVAHSADLARMSPQDWLTHHLQGYFRIAHGSDL